MATEMIKVDPDEFRELVKNVEFIKAILLSHRPYPDPEGELSDWAKRELEESRASPDSENISHEEVKKMILGK